MSLGDQSMALTASQAPYGQIGAAATPGGPQERHWPQPLLPHAGQFATCWNAYEGAFPGVKSSSTNVYCCCLYHGKHVPMHMHAHLDMPLVFTIAASD